MQETDQVRRQQRSFNDNDAECQSCGVRQRAVCDNLRDVTTSTVAVLNNVRAQSEEVITTVRCSTRYDDNGAVFNAVRRQRCGVRRGTTTTVLCSTRYDDNGAVFDAVR